MLPILYPLEDEEASLLETPRSRALAVVSYQGTEPGGAPLHITAGGSTTGRLPYRTDEPTVTFLPSATNSTASRNENIRRTFHQRREVPPIATTPFPEDDIIPVQRKRGLMFAKFRPWLLISAIVFVFLAFTYRANVWQSEITAYIRSGTKAPNGHDTDCKSKKFRKETLKLLRERPLADMYGTDKVQRFEASDITGNPKNSHLYLVLDNSFMLGRLDSSLLTYPSHQESLDHYQLLEWPVATGDIQSGFEFIAYNASADTYIIGEEAKANRHGTHHARMFEATFTLNKTIVHQDCRSEFEFTSSNKGFEGAQVIEIGGVSYLLGLCEGNYCKGKSRGRESGNGRMVLMVKDDSDACVYRTVEVINLPAEANFEDYSALTIYDHPTGTVLAIVSQVNSALYLADLTVGPDGIELKTRKTYDFPRNDKCEIKYCNVEGVYFLSPDVIITTSDLMKGNGKQPFRCHEKDESVHVFQIPP